VSAVRLRLMAVAVAAFLLGTLAGPMLAGTALAPITLQPGQQVTIIAATPAPTPKLTPSPSPSPTPTPVPTPTPTPTATPIPAPTPTSTLCGTLQGRIDAAPTGSVLNLTGCTYTVGAWVTKALTIVGGTLFVPANTIGVTLAANNVTINGMTFIGTQTSDLGVFSDGSYGGPFAGLVVTNSHFSALNEGVELKHSISPVVSFNTITDCRYAGIILFSATGGLVTHNALKTIGYTTDSQVNAYGIMVNDQETPQSSDVVVSYNTVVDVPSWHGLDTHGGIRISFIGNTVSAARRGLFITDSDTGPAASIVVTGNQILSPAPLTDPLTPVTLYRVGGATFTGNTITGWGSDSPTSSQPWFDFTGLSTGLVNGGGNVVTP